MGSHSCVRRAGKWGMGLSLGSQALAALPAFLQCALPSTCVSPPHTRAPTVCQARRCALGMAGNSETWEGRNCRT